MIFNLYFNNYKLKMKVFDFLSLSPSLYLLKQDRGKNKLGGFFSIIYLLLMISLTIYYIYIYSLVQTII